MNLVTDNPETVFNKVTKVGGQNSTARDIHDESRETVSGSIIYSGERF